MGFQSSLWDRLVLVRFGNIGMHVRSEVPIGKGYYIFSIMTSRKKKKKVLFIQPSICQERTEHRIFSWALPLICVFADGMRWGSDGDRQPCRMKTRGVTLSRACTLVFWLSNETFFFAFGYGLQRECVSFLPAGDARTSIAAACVCSLCSFIPWCPPFVHAHLLGTHSSRKQATDATGNRRPTYVSESTCIRSITHSMENAIRVRVRASWLTFTIPHDDPPHESILFYKHNTMPIGSRNPFSHV